MEVQIENVYFRKKDVARKAIILFLKKDDNSFFKKGNECKNNYDIVNGLNPGVSVVRIV